MRSDRRLRSLRRQGRRPHPGTERGAHAIMQIMRSRAHNGAYVVYMGLTARVRVISCIMVNGRTASCLTARERRRLTLAGRPFTPRCTGPDEGRSPQGRGDLPYTEQLNSQRAYGLSGDTGGQQRAVWISATTRTTPASSSASYTSR